MKHDEKICWAIDLGLIRYGPAWHLQKQLVSARKAGLLPDVLLFCEHPHVITLGRNGKLDHLRAGDRVLSQMGVEFFNSDRGGDITYHGPGQIVGYPILDLTQHRRDVRWYVEQLEEAMIRTSAELGIAARRIPEWHGIWVDTPAGEEKLAALGVHLSRWVTSHGFAYNVSTDLRFFDLIVPCGIAGKRATSLERILGHLASPADIRPRLAAHFQDVFHRELVPVSRDELQSVLAQHAAQESPGAVLAGGLAR